MNQSISESEASANVGRHTIVSLDVVYESWFSQGRDPCSAQHSREPRGLIVAECLQAFKLQVTAL